MVRGGVRVARGVNVVQYRVLVKKIREKPQ